MDETRDPKVGEKLFWLLVVAAILHMLYYYPLVPERVASHFDKWGRPNGWSSKVVFFTVYAGAVLLTAVMSVSIRLSLRRTPDKYISLPNKDFWLAPQRRERSMAVIARYFSSFFSATLLLLIGTMHLAIRVNLGQGQGLGQWFFFLFAAYLLFTLVWTISLLVRFRVKEQENDMMAGRR